MTSSSSRQKILVVDNNPVICTLLGVLLGEEFEIHTTTSSQEAIDLARTSAPDIILLDLMMPAPDGYDVCSALKDDRQTADIPVIFLTAVDDEQNEAKCLSMGAVDYIKKPFSPSIVRARIRTHLELKQQRDNLRKTTEALSQKIDSQHKRNQKAQLEKERAAKQAAMIHSGRLTAIGEMATCMAHEIGNPLNAIGIILQKWEMWLHKKDLPLEKLSKDIAEMKENISRISRLTSHIRSFGRSRQQVVETDIPTVVREAISLCRMQHSNKEIRLKEEIAGDVPRIKIEPAELEQVVLNLLSNAYYSLEAGQFNDDRQPMVRVCVKGDGDKISILIEDNGSGVPEGLEEQIFDPFYTTKPSAKGTGLGLSISKDIMEKFNGGLILHNQPGQGALFEAWLPAPSIKIADKPSRAKTA